MCDTVFFFSSSLCFTGDQPGADLGPLISPDAKKRVCELIQSGVDEGASVSVAVVCGVFTIL